MKLNLKSSILETSEAFSEESFRIDDVALIMEILRGKMYSNPVRTIVQEISSNARDAHREAGIPHIPIIVHLPTITEPYFSVRDQGPGITPERMSKIFLGYGNTTKRLDDVETGGFGLGAKCPWAYVEQFCVESTTPEIRDGQEVLVKRDYVCVIDPSRVGKVLKVNEQVVAEGRGVLYTVASQTADIHKFALYAMDIFRWWTPRPECHIDWATVEKPVYSGPGWHAAPAATGGYHTCEALIDGVPYKINDSQALPLDLHTRAILSKWKFFLEFKVGELVPNANRESLDYKDNNTNTALAAALNDAAEHIIKVVTNAIENAPNLLKAYKVFNTSSPIVKSATWMVTDNENAQLVEVSNNFHFHLGLGRAYTFSMQGGKITRKQGCKISLWMADHVVFDYGCKTPSLRVRTMLEKEPKANIVMVSWNTDKDNFEEFKQRHFLHYWGAIDLDTIPPTKAPKVQPIQISSSYIKSLIRVRVPGCPHYLNGWRVINDIPASGIYVVLANKETYSNKYQVFYGDLDLISRYLLTDSEGHYPKIYGVRKQIIKSLPSGWEPLYNAIKNVVSKNADGPFTPLTDIHLHHGLSNLDKDVYNIIVKEVLPQEKYTEVSLVKWIKESVRVASILSLNRAMWIGSEITKISLKEDKTLFNLHTQVNEEFPIIAFMEGVKKVPINNPNAPDIVGLNLGSCSRASVEEIVQVITKLMDDQLKNRTT